MRRRARALAPRPGEQVGGRRQFLGRGDVDAEVEPRRGVDPGGEHVVAVADPGDRACPRSSPRCSSNVMHVGHDLAGMRALGQPVDDRHGGVLGEFAHRVRGRACGSRSRRRSATARAPCRRSSRRGRAASRAPVSMIVSPPSSRMPTSKETRVRVDGLSKIIASVLPSSGRSLRRWPRRAASRFMLAAAAQNARAARSAGEVGEIEEMPWRCGHSARSLHLRRLLDRGARRGRAARPPRRRSASSMISGGSRRSDIVAGRRPSSRSSARAAVARSVFGTRHLRPSSSPSPRMSSMTPGWRSFSSASALLQQQADLLDLLEEAGRQHDVEHRVADRHGERIAAEGRAVHAGRHALARLARREAGAHREAAADALGDRHDVGRRRRRAGRRRACRCGRRRSAPRRRSAAGRARRTARAGRAGTAAARGRTPPSPWIGSIRIAAVSGPIAAFSASWSPNGTWSKPSTFGPKPSRYFFCPPAAMVASVRPWKAPSKVMMRKRSGWPFAEWYLRAILIAHSSASAPEFVKKTWSAKVLSTSRCASRSPSGMR